MSGCFLLITVAALGYILIAFFPSCGVWQRRKSKNISSPFPNLGTDEIFGICVSAAEHRVTVCLVCNRERTLMRWFFVVMLCGGAGLFLSAQYQIPQLLLWPLLALGTTMWGLAKWMERQEAETKRNHDRR